jgi:hypothetical protein
MKLTPVVRAARRIDRAIDHVAGPRRVLIEVRSPMNLEVLRPVWSRLAADPRVELTFTAEEASWVRPSLEAGGLAHHMIPLTKAPWRRFDLAFNADPWNALPLRRCWKRANFFHGVAGKYDLDDPTTLGRNVDFAIYDRVMFPNEDRLRRYVDAGVVPAARAALVGFPKSDDLVNNRFSSVQVRADLGLEPTRETVLYAPTYSPASSLHLAGEAIIEKVLASGRNLIVKLHDRALMPHAKYTGNVNWRQRLARYSGHPRYAFAIGADVRPYMAAADVMITDHSTTGFEFALLDRPIVVFDAPDLLHHARINPEKWHLLRGTADIAYRAEELPAVLTRAISSPDRLAAERRAAARMLFAFPGQATARALAVLYELLEMKESRELHEVREVPVS